MERPSKPWSQGKNSLTCPYTLFRSVFMNKSYFVKRTSIGKLNKMVFWLWNDGEFLPWDLGGVLGRSILHYYWPVSSMQVGRSRTHPVFQKLYHTNILHSQTTWIIQVVSYKSFNVRTAWQHAQFHFWWQKISQNIITTINRQISFKTDS